MRIVVPEVIGSFLPGAIQVGHPKLGARWQVKVREMQGHPGGFGQMQGHHVGRHVRLRREIRFEGLNHPVQVLSVLFGLLLCAQPGRRHIEGRHFHHLSRRGQQDVGTRLGIGLGEKLLRKKQHGHQAGEDESNHGHGFQALQVRAPKIRR